MRTLVPASLLLLALACGPDAAVPARPSQQLVQSVQEWHSFHHPDCPGMSLVDRDIRGGGLEIWTVEACGRRYRYQVNVTEELGSRQVSVHSLED